MLEIQKKIYNLLKKNILFLKYIFEIFKKNLLYLKYILDFKDIFLLKRFLNKKQIFIYLYFSKSNSLNKYKHKYKWSYYSCISEKYNYTYFRFPKSANSSIISTLYFAETQKIINTLENIQIIKDYYFKQLNHLNQNQIEIYKNSNFKFLFSRNPYKRIISTFLEKVANHKKSKQKLLVTNFLGLKPNEEITFDQFLFFLESGGINTNGHWASQTEILPISKEYIDFFGKIENLNDDLNFVLKEIFKRSIPIKNILEHSTILEKRFINIEDKNLKRVYKLYEEDFDNFKYKKDSYSQF